MEKIIRENSFEGAPGGSVGTLNYSVGYGTPAGGNISQSPDKFTSSTKTVNHVGNESSQSFEVGKLPERPDRKSSSGAPIHPSAMSDQGSFENSSPSGDAESPNTVNFDGTSPLPDENSSTMDPDTKNTDTTNTEPEPENKPIDPNKGLDKEVDKVFKKRVTPSPDEVLSALQWEMNQMVKKDKYIAKQIVLKNLKKDPNYYSRLDMLNIDDDKMKVDESKKTTFDKTKALLDQMVADKKKGRVVQNSVEINTIFEDLWNKRHGFRKS